MELNGPLSRHADNTIIIACDGQPTDAVAPSWLDGGPTDPVRVPVGASIFPAEVPRPSRRWPARRYPDIRYWAEYERGGHFPALEVPELLVTDLRAAG